jgi:hypothetical protein
MRDVMDWGMKGILTEIGNPRILRSQDRFSLHPVLTKNLPAIPIGNLTGDGFVTLLFWAGQSRDAQFLCHEFTRIFAKSLKNSCAFAKFVVKVLGFPL